MTCLCDSEVSSCITSFFNLVEKWREVAQMLDTADPHLWCVHPGPCTALSVAWMLSHSQPARPKAHGGYSAVLTSQGPASEEANGAPLRTETWRFTLAEVTAYSRLCSETKKIPESNSNTASQGPLWSFGIPTMGFPLQATLPLLN